MSEVRIHTSLRNAASSPTSRAELNVMRQRAWHEQNIVVLHIDEVTDDWVKQAIKNLMAKQHGKRMKR